MSTSYYQVVGRSTWTIDHPAGDSIAYRPGQIFEASPLAPSVQRGLRVNSLRELSPREATALRNAEIVTLKVRAEAAAKLEAAKAAPALPGATAVVAKPSEPPRPPEPILKKSASKKSDSGE